MGLKILLCVSADQATAALWRGRRLTGCRRFDNDESGWNAFGNFLSAARGTPVHVMVDTVDEDYRFETLPHATGRDRSEMVARKLKQLYRGTSYFSYSLQNREADKRKDDRYLFAAFTNPDLLAPWLRAINAQGLPVAGVYSLPMVSVSLIGHLKVKHPNLLLVTKSSAGVRQTFFKNLRFRISRLTPLHGQAESADQYYADEVSNTRMYLDALTITHVDDTLQVVILDQDDSLGGLPAAISRGRPNMQCSLLSRAQIISRFSIDPAAVDASTDALHLHLLGESAPNHNFAPANVTQGFDRYVGRRMIYVGAAAILGVSVIWSGYNVFATMQAGEEVAGLRRQTADFQARYQQATAQFPEAPTTSENLRHTVEIAGQIKSSVRTPDRLFGVVARAMDASPQVQLLRLSWVYGEPVPSGDAQGRADRVPPPPGTLVESGVLRGEIKPFSGDYKGAMAAINAFAAQLGKDPSVAEVRALKLPFNASSESGIRGSTNTPGSTGGAEFEFAVIFKAGA